MKCPACKGENDDDAQFCIHCRQTLVHASTLTPPPKKGSGAGLFIGVALVVLVIVAFLSGWIPFFSAPKHDCSVTEGYVTIQNVPGSDAYLTLLDNDNNVAKTLHLSAGSQGTITGICNGRYYLYYEFGTQSDSSSQTVATLKTRAEKFVDPLDFTGDNYYEVSLVPGSGNARTTSDSYNRT
jgi:hypothetical protein